MQILQHAATLPGARDRVVDCHQYVSRAARANQRFSPWIKYGGWDALKNWWPISGLVMHSPAADCLLCRLIFKISLQREPQIRLKWWQKKPLKARSRQNYFLNYLAIVHLAHQTKWSLFSLADCDIWSKEFSSRPDESKSFSHFAPEWIQDGCLTW
jgi:hypothetical protein